ncbi:MAG TPA: LamG domain-containing protein [Chthoniobacteraceae bacterium]|nr:LamG domain-containing protein [Chthoniobacteraceae bacterium]
MNKAALLALVYLIWLFPVWGEIREGEIILQWQGRTDINELAHGDPRPGQLVPQTVSGTLGPYDELVFEVEPQEAPQGRQYLDLLLPGGASLDRFTVACYLYPTRGRTREELVSAIGPEGRTGFSLRNSWRIPVFEFGDGAINSVTTVQHRGRSEVALDLDCWQHLAVVFDQGTLRFYKNGILIGKSETGLGEIAFGTGTSLRIGAHPYVKAGSDSPLASYPFAGRMTGLFLSGQALNEEEIFELMERMLRP